MTREDIVRMAREAGYPLDEAQSDIVLRFQAVLADFAQAAYAAGAAAERETIAKKFDGPVWSYDYREIAAAIRARGE
jgi:hypothetical protein